MPMYTHPLPGYAYGLNSVVFSRLGCTRERMGLTAFHSKIAEPNKALRISNYYRVTNELAKVLKKNKKSEML